MTAREDILARIRSANGHASTPEQAHRAWHDLPREYVTTGRHAPEEVLALFEDRLRDYDATVLRCAQAEVAITIAKLLNGRAKQHMLIPVGLPPQWLPGGFGFVTDDAFTATQLDRFDGVLTAASIAIAETGTVVLQSVPGQGRRAVSLVPDYHLCIVRAVDVVETVSEGMARLNGTANLPTTFVSGPSATADIEMTRIKGVHGPRFLDVLILE
jgi:L-lactate dehydrogenase complex protein LldG